MPQKLYPLLEACRRFDVPKSVAISAVITESLETTLKFMSEGNRQRARHFVTEQEIRRFHQEYVAARDYDKSQPQPEPEPKTWARTTDAYNHSARARIEERQMLQELGLL